MSKLKKLRKKIAGKYRGDPGGESLPETRRGNNELKEKDA